MLTYSDHRHLLKLRKLICSLALCAISAAAQTTTPLISINCGGSAYTAVDGTQWSGDQYFSSGDLLYTSNPISGTQDLTIYRTARRGLYSDFSYAIPLPNAAYVLRLRFAEIAYSGAGQRVFNVGVNGAPVLTNFDILKEVPALTVDDKQFNVTVSNGILEIDVNGVVGRGLLNGIQVFPSSGSAPAPTPVLTLSNSTLSFSGTTGGGNPAAQPVTVSNTGAGTLAWSATSNQSWLSISPASGNAPAAPSVSANISGLAAGTYSGSITIAAAGATGSPQSIQVSLVVAAPPSSPPPPAAATISINCGGQAYTGADGTNWSADQYFSSGDLLYNASQITGTQDLYLYRTARRGLYSDFSYSIPAANGSYTLVLKFAEIAYSARGQRVFNVLANGSPVLTNFDILAEVPPLTADDKRFPVTVSNGLLQIDVKGVTGFGLLNAIQLIPGSVPPPSSAPALSVSPSGLTFTATCGGANPAQQSIQISNNGSGTLNWSASHSQSWLTLAASSGSGAAAVSIQPAAGSLAAGTYTDTITVNAPGATPSSASVPVTFTVTAAAPPPAAPALSVSPSSLAFTATAGGTNPTARSVQISNSGGGTLSWSAARTQSWLTLSASSGSGAAALSVQAAVGSLAAGTYTDTITVNAPGATPSSASVPVTFTITAAQPPPAAAAISINCGGQAYTGADGTNWSADQYFSSGDLLYTSNPVTGTQDLYLYRTARRGLYSDFSYSIPAANGSYTLVLKFAEIAYSARGQRVFNVLVNGSPVLTNFDILAEVPPLTADDKRFPVTVSNGLLQIDVKGVTGLGLLNAIQLLPGSVSPPSSAPALSVSPSGLAFTATGGGTNPAPQTIQISNCGTLSWSAARTQSWLTLSASSGSGAGAVSIQPAVGSLAAGTYTDTITVNAPGATPSSASVPVTFTVTAPAPPPAAPALSVSPSGLAFTATAGGTNPAAQSVQISNSGGGTLSWSAARTQSWLTLSASSGSGAAAVSVQAAVGSLAAGTYTDTITVNAPGATPSSASVPVTFTVTAAAPPPPSPPPGGNSANTDQWMANSNPPQTFDPNGGPVLYNGIQLPSAWPPPTSPTMAYRLPPYILNPPATIPVGVGRQLFVDDFLIAQTTLTRVQHQPAMYPGNPVLSPNTQGMDTQANNAFPFSGGVWYDPAAGLYKLWYFSGSCGNCVGYAQSPDGKNWTKPTFNDLDPNIGSNGTNVVLHYAGGMDTVTVWMDLHDDPSRKFKLFNSYPDGPGGAYVFDTFYSPDGIHWTGRQPMQPLALSDRSTVFYNPFRKVWVASDRNSPGSLPATATVPARQVKRARYYSESSNLTTWTPADPFTEFWQAADERDPVYPNTATYPELYNLDATPYESLMVGLFSMYYPSSPDLVEINVGFSRDGFDWVRPTRGGGPNNAFIPAANLVGAWNGYNSQSAGGGFLVVGDNLYFYFSGRDSRHNSETSATKRQTGLAVLRRDGFYSMDAGSSEGTLTTRPLTVSGTHVFVNVADPSGQLKVEVLDQNSNVMPGFAKANSQVISVDKTAQEVTWNGNTLASLAGQTVRLKFYLTNGSLYSFWVTPSASGASYGYVAAGGPGFTSDVDTVGSAANTTPPNTVADPTFTPGGGTYGGNIQVSIATTTPGALIHYTTDGTDPTANSPLYTGSISLIAPVSKTIKAIAMSSGLNNSNIVIAMYSLAADATPPNRGLGSPSGSLPSGTTQTTISLRTSEAATCRYASSPNVAYGSMTNTFSTSDGITQTATVTGLSDNNVYNYYVRCIDASGNANTDDYAINFSVGNAVLFYQYLEGEGAQLTSPMVPGNDSLASGGAYISTASGTGAAVFSVTVPAAGVYYLWGRVLSVDSNSDSFFVNADNGPQDVYDTAEGTWSASWQWTRVSGRGSTGVANAIPQRSFALAAGTHTFTFAGRDPNTKLDEILVTSDSSFVPTGTGKATP